MARIGLSEIITGAFINRFRGLAGSSGTNGSLTAALNGTSSTQSISNGLRVGAQTFANSMQILNSGISLINVSKETLGELDKITDKLINLSERAASASAGSDTRDQMRVEFRQAALEFRRVVDNSELKGINYLSKDGLEDVFKKIGLDSQQSSSIASVFSKFVTSVKDDNLASEYVKGSRPMDLSPSVYELGTKTVTEETGITTDATLLAVNETNGYSLVKSSDDLIEGENSENHQQLFLVDATGNVVSQVTNNDGTYSDYVAGDLSKDNLTVAYITETGSERRIWTVNIGSIGSDPSTLSPNDTSISSSDFNDLSAIKLNNDASLFAYVMGPNDLYMTTADGTSPELAISSLFNIRDFGFMTFNTIGFSYSDGADVQGGAHEYIQGSDIWQPLTGLPSMGASSSHIGFLEADATYDTEGFFSYVSSVDDQLYVYQYDGYTAAESPVDSTLQYSADAGSGATIDAISMAFNSTTNQADVGILGSILGSADRELFRVNTDDGFTFNQLTDQTIDTAQGGISTVNSLFVTENGSSLDSLYYMGVPIGAPTEWSATISTTSTETRYLSANTVEFDKILDGDIGTRPDAYRMLNDLMALKGQIKDNIKALDNAAEEIKKNSKFLRKVGLSFVEMADQITNSTDADTVALKLQKLIRSQTGAALAQAENLEAITVATLTYGS